MWPWQRARQADHPAESAGPGVPVAARQREWGTLPSIQRSVGAMRPVSPQQDFGDSLVSWRNPSFLAPLGHLVSADAPSGVIHRLIEPVAPPTTGPAGSALEFAAAAPRRPKGGVVQRMLATITPWASRDNEPADPEPYRGYGTRASPDTASHQGEQAPAPAASRTTAPVVAASVQRSGPGSAPATPAPMTQAPSPALPILELPVLQARTQLTGEPDVGEVPTLGTDPPPSATHPVDGGVGGPADVIGQERRASAPAVETSGRLTPISPTVQRVGTAWSAAPQRPEDGGGGDGGVGDGGVGEVPILGLGPPPSATQVAADEAGGPAEFASQERRAGAPAPLVAPTVQRAAETDPAALPLPSTTSRAGASRRLGLGPPLAPDAVTAQLSQATSMTRPPLVPPASFPAGPVSPPEAQVTEGAPRPVSEMIVPLLGQPGSALQADAAVSDAAVSDAAVTTEPVVQAARDPSPPLAPSASPQPPSPLLPVLRVYAPVSSPPAEPSAPPRPAPPVVARLVGDRTPPLLTATAAPSSGPRETGGGQQPPMQPMSTAPLHPAGPTAGPAPLPARLTPSLQQTAPVVSASAPQAPQPALVVQAAPAEAPEALVPTAPAVPPAQDIAADLGADVPGEPDNPGQAPSAAPAGAPPAGAPAAGAGAAGAGGAGNLAGSPDELVKKLFDPLLRRLKTELRLDRERRGMLTDLRH